MSDDQLPAIIPAADLTTQADTYIVPALIANAGDQAGWRYIEFLPSPFAILIPAEPMHAHAPSSFLGVKIMVGH
jgi:hypothetical protein